jgi:hypothetical protein
MRRTQPEHISSAFAPRKRTTDLRVDEGRALVPLYLDLGKVSAWPLGARRHALRSVLPFAFSFESATADCAPLWAHGPIVANDVLWSSHDRATLPMNRIHAHCDGERDAREPSGEGHRLRRPNSNRNRRRQHHCGGQQPRKLPAFRDMANPTRGLER